MTDKRHLYIRQLLRCYKEPFSPNVYTCHYRIPFDDNEQYLTFGHDEGIEHVIQYIDKLEEKIEHLRYVEKIIRVVEGRDSF